LYNFFWDFVLEHLVNILYFGCYLLPMKLISYSINFIGNLQNEIIIVKNHYLIKSLVPFHLIFNTL